MARTKSSYLRGKGDSRFVQDWSEEQLRKKVCNASVLSLKQVRVAIKMLRSETQPRTFNNEANQRSLILRGVWLALKKTAKEEQVSILRKLVFEQKDVLLVAATGFGKSIIFQAYSVLTSTTTIVVVPLVKLADQQAESINEVAGCKAGVIDADTKRKDPTLIKDVAACKYSHILLGPEQVFSDEFKPIMRDPKFKDSAGLIAIDEVHLITDWKDFRTDFKNIQAMRRWLHPDTPMFGCTATLSKMGEKEVRLHAGFREEPALEVTRLSVDRPDVAISLIGVGKRKMSDYGILRFVFNDFKERGGVRKTIIFIDSHRKANAITDGLKEAAEEIGVPHGADSVGMFTSRVATFDKDKTYDDFVKADSHIRVIVATTSLGMGMDIRDIDQVVQWGMPESKSLADIWQRFGRAARGPGRKGMAYAFLPKANLEAKKTTATRLMPPPSQRTRYRHTMAHSRKENGPSQYTPYTPYPLTPRVSQGFPSPIPATQSRSQFPPTPLTARSSLLSQPPMTAYDEIETQSVASDKSSETGASNTDGEDGEDGGDNDVDDDDVDADVRELRKHRAKNKELEEELALAWLQFGDKACMREVILDYLGDRVDPRRDKQRCCNKCNAELEKIVIQYPAPTQAKVQKAPNASSKCGIAAAQIAKYCEERASDLQLMGPSPWSSVPGYLFMESSVQWRLSRLYTSNRLHGESELGVRTLSLLRDKITAEEWPLIDTEGEALIEFLYSIRKDVVDRWNKLKEKRAADKAKKQGTRR